MTQTSNSEFGIRAGFPICVHGTELDLCLECSQIAESPAPISSEVTKQQTSTEELKLCKDCHHVASSAVSWENYRCMAPENFQGINLVDGHKEYRAEFCKDQRAWGAPDYCSSYGKWFKQKEVLPPVTPSTEGDFKATDLEDLGKKAADRVAALKNKNKNKTSQFENL